MNKKVIIVGENHLQNIAEIKKILGDDIQIMSSCSHAVEPELRGTQETLLFQNPYEELMRSVEYHDPIMKAKQAKLKRIKQELMNYMDGRYTLNNVYKQIQNRTCKLPRRVRDYVALHYTESGEFRSNEEIEQLINNKYL